MTAPTPDGEDERLRQLHDLLVLDTEPEQVFDSLARLASQICGVPIALVSLIDSQRQWFKANVGLSEVSETPRDMAFCAHAILGEAVFEIPDAQADQRFADNPLVTGTPDIRFYAGAPLVLPSGQRVGTLCVIDRQARQLDAGQREMLRSLAKIASETLVMRRDLITSALTAKSSYEQALRASESFLQRTGRVAGVGGWQFDLLTGALTWSTQTRVIHEVPPDYEPALASAIEFYAPEARPQIERAVEAAIASGQPWDLELPFITAQGRSIRVRAQGEAEFENGVAVRLVGAFQDITERSRNEQALRELTAIIDHTTDFIVQTDWRGSITYMNPAARAITGLTPDAALDGLTFDQFNTEATNRHFAEVIGPAVAASGVWVGETTVRVAGGQVLPVSHMVLAHRDAQGRTARYSAVMRDISAAARTRRTLQLQTTTLREVTEAIPAIVAVVSTDLRYRFINGSFERWVDQPRDHVIGRTIAEVVGAQDFEASRPFIQRVLAGETVQFERVNPQRGNGRNLAMRYTPLIAEDGTIDGFIGVGQDITVHRLEQGRLLQLSERDPLTGLLNRAGFERRIALEVDEGRGAQLALLYVDLDHFKNVNDAFGHPVGDQVLRGFAQRVKSVLRPTDVVARLGGDEFAVLLFSVREASHAYAVGEKVIAVAGAPFDVDGTGGQRPRIGASVGVAVGVHAQDWHELVARADSQLYRAKQGGRGRQAGVTDWGEP